MSAADKARRQADERQRRVEVAHRYEVELAHGLRRLAVLRRRDKRQRMMTSTYRAAAGVLRYSHDSEALDSARDFLVMHATEQARERLERDAPYLEAHGASIPGEAIILAAETIGEERGRGAARELERPRRLAGL